MVHRATSTVVLVGLLVLTAGCAGLTGDGPPSTPTATPSDGSPTATGTPTADATPTAGETLTDDGTGEDANTGELPDLERRAWTTDGRLNRTALYAGHVETLRGATGYRTRSTFTYTLDNGSARVTEITTAVDADTAVRSERREDRWDVDSAFRTRRYVNRSTVTVVSGFENGTVTRRSTNPTGEPFERTVRDAPIRELGVAYGVSNVNWTADGRTEYHGDQVYRYRGVGLSRTSNLADRATLSEARLLVDRHGRIRHVSLTAEGQFAFVDIDGRLPATVTYEATVSDVNATTVEQPAWVEGDT